MILYTLGDRHPEGAQLTHGNLARNVEVTVQNLLRSVRTMSCSARFRCSTPWARRAA